MQAILAGKLGAAVLAGLLSVLSPCVLPILPIVLSSAVSAHRLGPLALAAGLAISFTGIGLFVATLGYSAGFGGGAFQMIGAIILALIGITLLVPKLQALATAAVGPFGTWIDRRFAPFSPTGLNGQFGMGLLFGAIWSPCSGPTLGAAAFLAASGRNMAEVPFIMLAFGIGAALPLVALGAISRATLLRWHAKVVTSSRIAKKVLGASLVVFGLLMATGANRDIEAFMVNHSPDWLLQLTTRF